MSKKKPQSVGRGDDYYIEQHFGIQQPGEIAQALRLTETLVVDYISKLNEAGVEPPKKPRNKLQRAGYDVDLKNGVVAATQQSSTIADESKGTSPFNPKKNSARNKAANPDLVLHDIK